MTGSPLTSPESYFADREPGPTILVVDDEEGARRRLKAVLSMTKDSRSIKVHYCANRAEALELLSSTPVHVALLDKNLGPDEKDDSQNGIKAIDEMRLLQPHLQVLVITGSKDPQDAVEAMKLGAFDYITKDLSDELLLCKINKAIEVSKITFKQFRQNRMSTPEASEIGGASKVFQEILSHAQILAETNRPVLLLGPSGTGKTTIASYIHKLRANFYQQQDRPFFRVDIGALAPEVVERDLFGSEKGAYTDAKMTQGFFELSNNGTLFLDEIGEASPELQTKLLTVIETGDFYRLGSSRKLNSKPKIILATNRNLEEMVKAGTFRQDLYYRISSFPIVMPPLSARREDIGDIIRALLPKVCKANNVPAKFEQLPPEFIAYIQTLPLQGNIREVEHLVERLLVYSPKDENRLPIMKDWKATLGIYARKSDRKSESTNSDRKSISMKDIATLPFDVLGSDFPGLTKFREMIDQKVVAEAISKHQKIDDRATALRVSKGHMSRLVTQANKSPVREGRTCTEQTLETVSTQGGVQ